LFVFIWSSALGNIRLLFSGSLPCHLLWEISDSCFLNHYLVICSGKYQTLVFWIITLASEDTCYLQNLCCWTPGTQTIDHVHVYHVTWPTNWSFCLEPFCIISKFWLKACPTNWSFCVYDLVYCFCLFFIVFVHDLRFLSMVFGSVHGLWFLSMIFGWFCPWFTVSVYGFWFCPWFMVSVYDFWLVLSMVYCFCLWFLVLSMVYGFCLW
jgi:hypothetical protein